MGGTGTSLSSGLCGNAGWNSWSGAAGAYCCKDIPISSTGPYSIHFIEELTDSRAKAEKACVSGGYGGLCSLGYIVGGEFETCAAGWLSDGRGYWRKSTVAGCGRAGYNDANVNQAGAFCCKRVPIRFIGNLRDPSTEPYYTYYTRDDALAACNCVGYPQLCSKKQITGFNHCAAGWLSDGNGYWLNEKRDGYWMNGYWMSCSRTAGFVNWGTTEAGAFCCTEDAGEPATGTATGTETEAGTGTGSHVPEPKAGVVNFVGDQLAPDMVVLLIVGAFL